MARTYPEPLQHIGGTWTPGGGAAREVHDPADGRGIARYRQADAADLDRALEVAAAGFATWRAVSPAERARVLHRCAESVRSRTDELAAILSRESGKPLAEARREMLRGAELIDWDASEAPRLYGRVLPSEAGVRRETVREPVGVVAALPAWNFPATFVCRKVGGALAAGCSVVLKATEETPGTCVALVRCFVDAGLPPGAVGLVLGEPSVICERLVSDPVVRAVTFTGSPRVGRIVAGLAAAHLKPCVLELGGHAPVIVCADADLRRAVAAAVAAKFRNNAGQVCVAPTRFLVHASRYDDFVGALTAAAKDVRVGAGDDPGTEMGPLISQDRVAAVHELVTDAVRRGARLTAGGAPLEGPGSFYAPTVLADVPDDARAMREEPFGPLALVTPFTELDEAIRRANSVPYGLAGYAFTDSARAVGRLTQGLECGYVAVNHIASAAVGSPFGGVKDSGYGKEGGAEGLQAFTTLKTVSHHWA